MLEKLFDKYPWMIWVLVIGLLFLGSYLESLV